MKTVWIILRASRRHVMAFSSKEKVLEFFQNQYPRKKRLRLMKHEHTKAYSIVNHTTHLEPYGILIYHVELDTGQFEIIW